MTAVLPVRAAGGGGGLAGFAADLLQALGDPGIGVLILLETVFPPIPSEAILPFAGYLTQAGSLSLVPLILWSTLGSVAGALLLYALGARVGLERSVRLLARTRLVSVRDLERGADRFARHGALAVLVGRMVPGVRSLISVPAGAARMPPVRSVLCTAIGSAIWNGVLIGLGAALGTQRALIDPILGSLEQIVLGAFALAVVALVVRRVRQRRARTAGTDPG